MLLLSPGTERVANVPYRQRCRSDCSTSVIEYHTSASKDFDSAVSSVSHSPFQNFTTFGAGGYCRETTHASVVSNSFIRHFLDGRVFSFFLVFQRLTPRWTAVLELRAVYATRACACTFSLLSGLASLKKFYCYLSGTDEAVARVWSATQV